MILELRHYFLFCIFIFGTFILEPSSVEKIMEIDEHIGCAMSGLIADAHTLVEHARVETQVLLMLFSLHL